MRNKQQHCDLLAVMVRELIEAHGCADMHVLYLLNAECRAGARVGNEDQHDHKD